mgnify:CR=1 FL=1
MVAETHSAYDNLSRNDIVDFVDREPSCYFPCRSRAGTPLNQTRSTNSLDL